MKERADVTALLERQRVVTLAGPGGCGKTRLASAVADDVAARFPDGSWWVELAGVREPGLVASAVHGALGATGALADRIGDRRVLLVIDNCEHVLTPCASLVAELVARCPRVAVLATSREPLMIAGEITIEVPPLAVPAPDASSAEEVRRADAARLFELRARQVRHDFELDDDRAAAVADICRRLDGIPLAVELAAARIRVLTPAQIAAGLSDRFRLLTGGYRTAPPRQQTLDASVRWSYGLLRDTERLVLARLSVFAGAFDLEAARDVATGPDVASADVLDAITALAERSLLHVDDHAGRARYRLLETIRLFAGERLDELDHPARVRDRHLDHFARLADRARAGLSGADAGTWTARLTADLDELRAAMAWTVESGRPVAVLDIAEPIHRFWLDRGRHAEMERWLRAATDDAAATDEDRARGLATATMAMIATGDQRSAHEFADRAVDVSRLVDLRAVLALGHAVRSFTGIHSALADDATIAGDVEQAMDLAPQVDDDASRALVLIFAGVGESYGGRLSRAVDLLSRAIECCEGSDTRFHLPAAHALRGVPLLLLGELRRARYDAHAALEWGDRVDRPGWQVVAHVVLAIAAALDGSTDTVHSRLSAAEALLDDTGLRPSMFETFLGRWAAFAAFHAGAADEARRACDALERSSSGHAARPNEASAALVLGLSALTDGRSDEARDHLDECRQLSIGPRTPFTLGRALVGLACLEHDVDRAWELAHDGLEVMADADDRIGAAEALEVIAGLAVGRDEPDRACRLLAAADRFHDEADTVRSPLHARRVGRWEAELRARLGTDAHASHLSEGARLTVAEAVDYARRGRGSRDRPATGWGSLTPTEREVVRLVGRGHTNGQIGERLFVSVHTVKKHLSHVYTKVGVTGRVELVAEAARRDL